MSLEWFTCLTEICAVVFSGVLGWGNVEATSKATERRSSVIMNAGRSKKKGPKTRITGTRLEGSRKGRKDPILNPRNPIKKRPEAPGFEPGDERQDGTEDPENPRAPRIKPPKGPKPRQRVTHAGRPMLLVNKGERFGKEATPWTSDPYERQPDDYYKYGPFGPHAWKGVVVGTPRPGTFADKIVVFFSTVENEEEHEEMAIHDAIIGFNKRVDYMDEGVGIQYFFAFVRPIVKLPRQAPVKEWTLVSQVALQSGEELDRWRLGHFLDRKSRENLSRCVSWYRPDLIYVKRPGYQVRFEPQKEFLTELLALLNPDNESESRNPESYFKTLCRLLGVRETEDEQQVGAIFDALSDERKFECLEHVFGSHPVQLLTPFTRRAREEEMRRKGAGGTNIFQETTGEDEDEVEDEYQEEGSWVEDDDDDDESSETTDNEDEDDEEAFDIDMENIDDDDFEELIDSNKQGKNGGMWEEEARAMQASSEESKDYEDQLLLEEVVKAAAQKTTEVADSETENQGSGSLLDSAVRPYTYTNLIKEIFIMRRMMVENPEWR